MASKNIFAEISNIPKKNFAAERKLERRFGVERESGQLLPGVWTAASVWDCGSGWNLTRSSLTPEVLAKLSWTTFKKKIMDKYCSERALDKIELEFQNLKKGSMSISDYSKQFLEKLSLVEHLAPNEKMKIKTHLLGLPAEMKMTVRNAKVATLEEAIEESFFVEDDIAQGKEERGQVSEKRKWIG
ncbi:hypothetical protein L6452_28011 [Arctium lappa]|uniref:Uncharacterized protein n=1 Tax=Arctium lappa TaxID=4217 RepID=A0ACB8ZXJ2_ARCLA|nr:hypothetical protein L6452_28011 [Arctium lappa]